MLKQRTSSLSQHAYALLLCLVVFVWIRQLNDATTCFALDVKSGTTNNNNVRSRTEELNRNLQYKGDTKENLSVTKDNFPVPFVSTTHEAKTVTIRTGSVSSHIIGTSSSGIVMPENRICSSADGQYTKQQQFISDWTVTDYNSTEHFVQYRQLSDFLIGSALQNQNNLVDATCKFRHIRYSHHFPHAMQQLYRCWSFWLSHPNLPPVLALDELRPTLSKFARGFVEVLQKSFNLTVTTEYDKNRPSVMSKDTGVWKDDIEITDFALPSPEHAYQLTKLFRSHTSLDNDQIAGCHKPINGQEQYPRIRILNRSPSAKRSILNIDEMQAAIRKRFPYSSVEVSYFEDKKFLQQVEFFMGTDILISPHGAQLTGIAFQAVSPCGHLVELLPQDYLVADYFGSLAKASGIHHSFFYITNNRTTNILPNGKRKYHYYKSQKYRDHPFCLGSMPLIMDALQVMVSNWRTCCSQHHSLNN